MTRDLFDPLDLELRRMLRDLSEGPPAPRDTRMRLRGALALGGGPFPPDGSGTEAALPRSIATRSAETVAGAGLAKTAAHVGRAWVLSGVGAAALVGGWFAFGPHAGDRSTDSPPASQETVAVARPAEPAPAIAPAKSEPPAAGHGDERMEARAAAPTGAPAPANAPSAASSTKSEKRVVDSSLAAERRLLDAARAALVAGDSPTGLDRLARHARQFPRGALAEERAALTVDALVAAGRYDEAKRRADGFYARYPGSIFAPSVGAALQAIP